MKVDLKSGLSIIRKEAPQPAGGQPPREVGAMETCLGALGCEATPWHHGEVQRGGDRPLLRHPLSLKHEVPLLPDVQVPRVKARVMSWDTQRPS